MTHTAPQAPLVTFGDITVTPEWVVTPRGALPLGQAQFVAQDCSITTRQVPGWAIVLAVVGFFFFLLGLLFLLVREERTTGYVQVQLVGPGLVHLTQIPVWNRAQVADLFARVTYANSVVASQRR